MKRPYLFVFGSVIFTATILARAALAQGTAFTYQGSLSHHGRPASGSFDFQLSIHGSINGAEDIIAGPLSRFKTPVTDGFFSVQLDFGSDVFDGNSRWLEIAVRTNGGTIFQTLAPRHSLTPAPYAITAGKVVSGGIAGGHYTNAVTFSSSSNRFNGAFTGDGDGLTNIPFAGLSPSARSSITNAAQSAARDATNNLTVGQIAGYGTASSFTSTSETEVNTFKGPVSITATNRSTGRSSLYIYQPDYFGPLPVLIEGDFRDGISGERYRTLIAPGNPAIWSNGYITLDGGVNSPPDTFHNPYMLGIFSDVPAAIEIVNQFDSTNAFIIEASGPRVSADARYPVVFAVSSRGQMTLANPYGTAFQDPQLLLTDSTALTNQTYALSSRGGIFTLGKYETTTRTQTTAIAINGGNVGIGTTNPAVALDVRGRMYAPTNTAPFSLTTGTSTLFTNSNNRSQVVLQIAFRSAGSGVPSCSIVSTNLVSTNKYVVSPIPAGLDITASVTNLYTLPVQTNAVVRVTDTSSGGARITLIDYKMFGQ